MKAEVRAKYITKWDDGRTILESPCKVNLITHEILHIGRRKIICSPYPNRVLDDYVEHLDAKFVSYKKAVRETALQNDTRRRKNHNDIVFPRRIHIFKEP